MPTSPAKTAKMTVLGGDRVHDNQRALSRLAEDLSTESPDLLTAPLTFGLVWLDLCRLAGEEPPADVAALAETPVALAAD